MVLVQNDISNGLCHAVWVVFIALCAVKWQSIYGFFSKCFKQGDEDWNSYLARGYDYFKQYFSSCSSPFWIFFRIAIISCVMLVFLLQYFIQAQRVNQTADYAADQTILSFTEQLDSHGNYFFELARYTKCASYCPLPNWCVQSVQNFVE